VALFDPGGARGFSNTPRAGCVRVTPDPPHRIVDPTGVGDAFRGGLMKGIASGANYKISAQLGSVAAAYALEHLGGSSHAYTVEEFSKRYEEHFGPLRLAHAETQRS
jgi:adenosine kinase